MSNLKSNILILVILISFSLILAIHVNKPFIGHHDFNGAFFSSISRNLLRYPLSQTKAGNVLGEGPLTLPFNYYTHNVPLYTWTLALLFHIFGTGHFQARSLSILFSIISLFLIFSISREILSKKAAYIALFFYGTSAAFLYFSTSVFPEAIAIPLSLLSMLLFIKFINRGKNRDYYLFLISATFAMWSVWGPFFLFPLIAFLYLYLNRKLDLKFFTVLVLPFFVFLIFLFWLFLQTGNFFGGGLIDALRFRLNLAAAAPGENLTIFKLIKTEILVGSAYYSKITLFLSLIWVISFLHQLFKRHLKKETLIILTLGLWGISYPLVFRNAAYIHDYFLIYLAPFFAIASAQIIVTLQAFVKNNFKKNFLASLLFFLPLLQVILIMPFAQALWKTGDFNVYLLGKKINSETQFSDKVLILSSQFGDHFGIFTDFYSNRWIAYEDFELADLQKVIRDYKYVVYMEGRDTPVSVDDYLKSKFKSENLSTFHIYKTQ